MNYLYVYMYRYVYLYTCLCIYIYTYVYVLENPIEHRLRLCRYKSWHVTLAYIYIHTCMLHTCMRTSMHTHIYTPCILTFIHACIHAQMIIYVYKYMNTCVQIKSHTNTRVRTYTYDIRIQIRFVVEHQMHEDDLPRILIQVFHGKPDFGCTTMHTLSVLFFPFLPLSVSIFCLSRTHALQLFTHIYVCIYKNTHTHA